MKRELEISSYNINIIKVGVETNSQISNYPGKI